MLGLAEVTIKNCKLIEGREKCSVSGISRERCLVVRNAGGVEIWGETEMGRRGRRRKEGLKQGNNHP